MSRAYWKAAMLEPIDRLPISGNPVEDTNVEASLERIFEKVNELMVAVNELLYREQTRNRQTRNRQTHTNVEKVGEDELLYCNDCHGGEVELWEATCSARQGRSEI